MKRDGDLRSGYEPVTKDCCPSTARRDICRSGYLSGDTQRRRTTLWVGTQSFALSSPAATSRVTTVAAASPACVVLTPSYLGCWGDQAGNPQLLHFVISVVRFKPSLAARLSAADHPTDALQRVQNQRPFESFRVVAAGEEMTTAVPAIGKELGSTPSSEGSRRVLLGSAARGYSRPRIQLSAAIVSAGICFNLLAHPATTNLDKCVTSAGISSGRARNVATGPGKH